MARNNVEFIRYILDLIEADPDTIKSVSKVDDLPQDQPVVVQTVDTNYTPYHVDDDEVEEVETALDKDDVFVPPLQAKLEIMKKLAGIEPKHQELLSVETSEEDEPF